MTHDPHRQRAQGLQRLRLTTAALGLTAVLGTAGLTWTISANDSSASTVAGSTTGDDTGTVAGSTTSSATVESDDSADEADASSGAS